MKIFVGHFGAEPATTAFKKAVEQVLCLRGHELVSDPTVADEIVIYGDRDAEWWLGQRGDLKVTCIVLRGTASIPPSERLRVFAMNELQSFVASLKAP